MSQEAAFVCDQAGELDAFASTRANYERFALLLVRVGHVPRLELTHLDFRVLLLLLGQKPGHYAAHHSTIAVACDSNQTSIKRALGRLRAAGLVLWALVPPHHRLPSGRHTRTNVNRYWVRLPQLSALLDVQSTGSQSTPSTRPNLPSSYGTEIKFEPPSPPIPPQRPPLRCKAISREGEEALVPIQTSKMLGPIRESWQKLGLGEFDRLSERALENRLAEGATHEQLEAAVAGASVDDWLRRRAKVPFAVVFASLASVQRFAHEGRKVLDLQASKAPSGPLQGQEEDAADDQENEPHDPLAANADDLRRVLPELTPTAAAETTTGKVEMVRKSADAGPSPALGASAPTIAKAFGPVSRAVEPPAGTTTPQRPPRRCSAPPPELAALLQALSGSMRLGRDQRDQETPQDRRLREQAEFDRKRLELVAALRSLEK